jgi:hypothetical protein
MLTSADFSRLAARGASMGVRGPTDIHVPGVALAVGNYTDAPGDMERELG